VPENQPPGADILNPQAVACFIRHVYQRYYDEFGRHFGKTVKRFSPMSLRCWPEARNAAWSREPPGSLNRQHLPGLRFHGASAALWYNDEPKAARYRKDYDRALAARLEETFYRPISEWCEAHGISLTGTRRGRRHRSPSLLPHPGQDIVWRYVEPDKPSALEGEQSTQAKCASSAISTWDAAAI